MKNQLVNKSIYSPQGKIIRDVVHGDIFIPTQFLKLIDTPEFQRLRRIKQLSVANLLFPSADHTRFSHSLGTFHIMNSIIMHFESKFLEMNIEINPKDKEIALAAALLHDIGHGPFSHAFEDIHPEKDKNKTHVAWTIEIITGKSDINRVLKEVFYDEFPNKVADLIKNQREAKHHTSSQEMDKIDLFSVLSSLVSGQLDADRMDYLLRDSMHTGVSFGNIDISRIINALRITVNKDKFFVCIPEKYLADIEQYLLARYQMHKGVYFHDFKVEMENVIRKTFKRAYELYHSNDLEFIPRNLKKIFECADLNIKEYVGLDDATLMAAFQEWRYSKDNILSDLCDTILDRNKFQKLHLLNSDNENIFHFKNEVKELLSKHNYKITDFESEFFWIEALAEFSIYKTNKENIWILQSNGLLKDISEVSKVIKKVDNKNSILEERTNLTFINYDMIMNIPGILDKHKLIEELEKIVKRYDNRNHIEIEKKYYFHNKDVFEKALDFVRSSKYSIECKGLKNQIDYYYDTKDAHLNNLEYTLRIRELEGKFELTVKKPTVSQKDEASTQSERFEHQIEIETKDISKHSNFITKYTGLEAKIVENVQNTLEIENNRQKYILKNKEVEFEMVFDNLKYKNINGKEYSEFQIEIELKSDYPHRVNLKLLTDLLEESIPELIISKDSKYRRGLKFTSSK